MSAASRCETRGRKRLPDHLCSRATLLRRSYYQRKKAGLVKAKSEIHKEYCGVAEIPEQHAQLIREIEAGCKWFWSNPAKPWRRAVAALYEGGFGVFRFNLDINIPLKFNRGLHG